MILTVAGIIVLYVIVWYLRLLWRLAHLLYRGWAGK